MRNLWGERPNMIQNTKRIQTHAERKLTHLSVKALLHSTAGIVLVLAITVTFQTKTEGKKLGLKTHAGQWQQNGGGDEAN